MLPNVMLLPKNQWQVQVDYAARVGAAGSPRIIPRIWAVTDVFLAWIA